METGPLILLAFVAGTLITSISYGRKSRNQAAKEEGQKLVDAFTILREGPVTHIVIDLVEYIDEERRLDRQASIVDLLAHAHPNQQLQDLEEVGEDRVRLRHLSSQVIRLANLASHLLVIPLLSSIAFFTPLGLRLIFPNMITTVLWYSIWGSLAMVFVLAGIFSLYVMQNRKAELDTRISKFQIDAM